MPKLTAIFLAFNASKTLEKFYYDFPKKLFDQIILIDDASEDNTFALARKLGIKCYRNPINLGYGGNMKRALNLALKASTDIIVDIHPDGEYKTTAIIPALRKIQEGAEFVLGNRFSSLTKPIKNGMHFWKFIPIIFLNLIDKIFMDVKIDDFHQGFRVYTKEMLSKINFNENSNDYLFSFELIAQAACQKIKISQVSVDTSYQGSKRGASFKNSLKYSLGTFRILLLFLLAQIGIRTKLFRR